MGPDVPGDADLDTAMGGPVVPKVTAHGGDTDAQPLKLLGPDEADLVSDGVDQLKVPVPGSRDAAREASASAHSGPDVLNAAGGMKAGAKFPAGAITDGKFMDAAVLPDPLVDGCTEITMFKDSSDGTFMDTADSDDVVTFLRTSAPRRADDVQAFQEAVLA